MGLCESESQTRLGLLLRVCRLSSVVDAIQNCKSKSFTRVALASESQDPNSHDGSDYGEQRGGIHASLKTTHTPEILLDQRQPEKSEDPPRLLPEESRACRATAEITELSGSHFDACTEQRCWGHVQSTFQDRRSCKAEEGGCIWSAVASD